MKNIDNKIKNIITNSVLNELKFKNDCSKCNIYIHKKVMTNNSDINSPSKLTNSPADIPQTLVLIDKHPELNWEHECEYEIYNSNTGDHVETIQAQLPPASFITNNEDYEPIGSLSQLKQISTETVDITITNKLKSLDCDVKGKKYAILFSGMSNNRHLNDHEYLYRVLIDVYNFNPENITVLNYDGTLNYSGSPKPIKNWPGDNTPYRIKINEEGSKSSLIKVLDSYKNKLKSDDLLFIHTNNHGSGPKTEEEVLTIPCALCCYPNWGLLTEVEFGKKLKTFPLFDKLVVMMEQCHSGGFSKPVIDNSTANNTVFSAACTNLKPSMGGSDFDPYAYNWIKKISENNQIKVHDAYVYAKEHTSPGDTPNESDNPINCGKTITLENENTKKSEKVQLEQSVSN